MLSLLPSLFFNLDIGATLYRWEVLPGASRTHISK